MSENPKYGMQKLDAIFNNFDVWLFQTNEASTSDKNSQTNPGESCSNEPHASGQSQLLTSSANSMKMLLGLMYKDLQEKNLLEIPTTVLLNQRIEEFKNDLIILKSENETQKIGINNSQRVNAKLEAQNFNMELKWQELILM